jgi:hypothetical protein
MNEDTQRQFAAMMMAHINDGSEQVLARLGVIEAHLAEQDVTLSHMTVRTILARGRLLVVA